MSLDFDINVDYYAVLGIDEQATPDELKTARKSLVLQYHPDVSSSSDATIKESAAIRFRAIQNAYEILSDAATRAKYDSARNIILGKSLLAADDTEIARGFVTQQDNYNFQVKKMASSNWQEIAANRLKTTAWQKLPLASKKIFRAAKPKHGFLINITQGAIVMLFVVGSQVITPRLALLSGRD